MLQTGCPGQLVLLLAHEGSLSDEADLHNRFAASYSRGEWFRPCPEILAYLIWYAGLSRRDRESSRWDAGWNSGWDYGWKSGFEQGLAQAEWDMEKHRLTQMYL